MGVHRAISVRVLTLSLCIGLAFILFLYRTATSAHTDMENKRFIESSPSWLDRQACRWLGICGGMNWWKHYRRSQPAPDVKPPQDKHTSRDFSDAWIDPAADPDSWSAQERKLRQIPNYVLEYAPLVYLYGKEKYWPSDIAEHLAHTYAKLENDKIPGFELRLWNLAELNKYNGTVFLTSEDDPESNPSWMLSPHNIPGVAKHEKKKPYEAVPGKRYGRKNMKEQARKEGWAVVDPHYQRDEEKSQPLEGDGDSERDEPAFEIKIPQIHTPGSESQRNLRRRRRSSSTQVSMQSETDGPGLRSNAPGFLICIDKGNGIVDAFWFYFYSFNEGNTVFGIRFGNHVGDWEHTMVRFQHGKPKGVYLSRHAWGSVYTYEALEKIGKRPIVYSGDGSHAHYPTPGRQDYVLPLGLLHDMTSRGPLWDPLQNLKSYTYDLETDNLRASLKNPRAPTSWFHFAGRWGDKSYDLSDRRQYRFFGEYHYVHGPTGPKFKKLRRTTLCENDKCDIKDHID